MEDWKQIYSRGEVPQVKPSSQIINLIPLFVEKAIKKILDHGCGTGRHVKYLAEQSFYVVGSDYSLDALSTARHLTSDLNNVNLVYSEMDRIPFENYFFDAIISNHVIQHALKFQRDKAFSEIDRTLRRNGFLFLRVPSTKHLVYGRGRKIEDNTFIDIEELPDGKTPHHYFCEQELKDYLENYTVLEMKHNSSHPEEKGFWKYGLEEWAVLARKS